MSTTTYRQYDNFSKTYRRFTVLRDMGNGYVLVETDEGVVKNMPAAAVALAEVVR